MTSSQQVLFAPPPVFAAWGRLHEAVSILQLQRLSWPHAVICSRRAQAQAVSCCREGAKAASTTSGASLLQLQLLLLLQEAALQLLQHLHREVQTFLLTAVMTPCNFMLVQTRSVRY